MSEPELVIRVGEHGRVKLLLVREAWTLNYTCTPTGVQQLPLSIINPHCTPGMSGCRNRWYGGAWSWSVIAIALAVTSDYHRLEPSVGCESCK